MRKLNLSPMSAACGMAAQPKALTIGGKNIRAEGWKEISALLRKNTPLSMDDRRFLADLLDGKLKRGRHYGTDTELQHRYMTSKAVALVDKIKKEQRCNVETACVAALDQLGVPLSDSGEEVEWLINARKQRQRR
jgi:hypothetical protein